MRSEAVRSGVGSRGEMVEGAGAVAGAEARNDLVGKGGDGPAEFALGRAMSPRTNDT